MEYAITRLMSFCTQAMVAVTTAVVAPTMVTTASAVSEYSNSGDIRATMKTPAVTMVAAWIRADTGVGPSMASGSQVCRPIWADLPMAPTNRSRQMTVSAWNSPPKTMKVASALFAAAAKMVSRSTVWNSRNVAKMPRAKPKSPTRLTRNALMAAALAAGLSYQKPISRYDARPTPSQPK